MMANVAMVKAFYAMLMNTGPKSTQASIVGIIIDEMHPCILFSSNRIAVKHLLSITSGQCIYT